jgi:hypothetical protein
MIGYSYFVMLDLMFDMSSWYPFLGQRFIRIFIHLVGGYLLLVDNFQKLFRIMVVPYLVGFVGIAIDPVRPGNKFQIAGRFKGIPHPFGAFLVRLMLGSVFHIPLQISLILYVARGGLIWESWKGTLSKPLLSSTVSLSSGYTPFVFLLLSVSLLCIQDLAILERTGEISGDPEA